MENIALNDSHCVHLHHPFSMMVCGPSGSGKTQLVSRIIRDHKSLIAPSLEKIIYCFNEWQSVYTSIQDICEFQYGFSESTIDKFDGSPGLLILDDLMNASGNSQLISDAFTRIGHHRNISIILIVQNLFFRGKYSRDISLNAHYFVCMKNPRDSGSIVTLARQMFGKQKAQRLGNIFNDATSDPYSYIFLNLKPTTPAHLQVLSHCFGEIDPCFYVYPL